MALNFDVMASADEKVCIEVVTKFDSCIDMTAEEYDEYIKSGASPDLLKLKKDKHIEDCTVFVLRKNLNWSSHEQLMKKQLSLDPVTKQPVLNPSFVMTDIQQSLMDIKNPKGAHHKISYTEDRPGIASAKLIEMLHNSGILMDLFSARSAATGGTKSELVQKKK